jgi:hypothetical protein
MAHRIFEFDKQQGLSQAWHCLTEIVPALSLESNWLTTWDHQPRPLNYEDGTPAGFSILHCSDVPELRIGQPYNPETFKPITNKDFLELVRASISGTPHKIVSVGSVRNRGRVFISLELAGMEKFKAAGRDFGAFLNFGNGHDKSSVLWVNTGNVCTVCDNTFSMNLLTVEGDSPTQQGSVTVDPNVKTSVRHTKNASLKLPALAKLIDQAVGVQAEFALALTGLDSVPVEKPRELFAGFLSRNTPEKELEKGQSTRGENTTSRLVELFHKGKGNLGKSRADAFSAVTDYYTHESSRGEDKFKQILSSEYGAGATAKADFWGMIQNTEHVDYMTERGTALIAATK